MIDAAATQAYNSRVRATVADLDRLTTSQADAVKNHGSRAEALLANADLVQFIHQYRFEVCDAIAGITAHDPDSNARRIALANHLAGMDAFIATLQRAVYMKDRVVKTQEGPRVSHADPTKEIRQP